MVWRRLGPALVLATMLTGSTAAASEAMVHVVERGDTLSSIARQTGCTVPVLQRHNALEGTLLRAGQTLRIPTCGTKAPATPSSICKADPASGPTVVVRAGDTLSQLAKRFEITTEAIMRCNALGGPTITVGQTLVVPTVTPQIRLVQGQSRGRPHRGKLVDGEQLPHDRGYFRRRPTSAYAAAHVVDHVRAAVARVRAHHPGVHRLAIGDLSAARGGWLPGHASHQSGRDVDLGLYFESVPSGYPDAFVRAKEGKLDVAALWTLVEALVAAAKQPGGPERIFLDYDIQRRLYEYARKHGRSKRSLEGLFQYPDGRFARDRLIQHVAHHDDHLHVRFGCPPKDHVCS